MSAKYGASKLGKLFGIISKYATKPSRDTVKLIGHDHLGNKYFEAYKPDNQFRQHQRYFERSEPVQSFDEVVDATHVPPAWDAWLRFRRKEPPSEEEVLDGEEYYRMQQEMAASKKKEEPTAASKPASLTRDGKVERKIPTGAYKRAKST